MLELLTWHPGLPQRLRLSPELNVWCWQVFRLLHVWARIAKAPSINAQFRVLNLPYL
jgi:hypothetical protein